MILDISIISRLKILLASYAHVYSHYIPGCAYLPRDFRLKLGAEIIQHLQRPKLILNSGAISSSWAPTRDPSAIAANAPSVAPPWCAAWICRKFLSWSWTAEQSPPSCGSPQVTTDPSAKIAANAAVVAWICCTVWSWSWMAEHPGNHWSIGQDCGKCAFCGLNLLHVPELILYCRAVSTKAGIAPSHHWSIGQDRYLWPESVALSWADVEPQSSRHQILDCPG